MGYYVDGYVTRDYAEGDTSIPLITPDALLLSISANNPNILGVEERILPSTLSLTLSVNNPRIVDDSTDATIVKITNTSNVVSTVIIDDDTLESYFIYDTSIKEANIKRIKSTVSIMWQMFANCSNMVKFSCSSGVQARDNIGAMFNSCLSLTDVGYMDTSLSHSFRTTFNNSGITEIPDWDYSNSTDMYMAFSRTTFTHARYLEINTLLDHTFHENTDLETSDGFSDCQYEDATTFQGCTSLQFDPCTPDKTTIVDIQILHAIIYQQKFAGSNSTRVQPDVLSLNILIDIPNHIGDGYVIFKDKGLVLNAEIWKYDYAGDFNATVFTSKLNLDLDFLPLSFYGAIDKYSYPASIVLNLFANTPRVTTPKVHQEITPVLSLINNKEMFLINGVENTNGVTTIKPYFLEIKGSVNPVYNFSRNVFINASSEELYLSVNSISRGENISSENLTLSLYANGLNPIDDDRVVFINNTQVNPKLIYEKNNYTSGYFAKKRQTIDGGSTVSVLKKSKFSQEATIKGTFIPISVAEEIMNNVTQDEFSIQFGSGANELVKYNLLSTPVSIKPLYEGAEYCDIEIKVLV